MIRTPLALEARGREALGDEVLVGVTGDVAPDHLPIEHPKFPSKVDLIDFVEDALGDTVVRPTVLGELLAGPCKIVIAQLVLLVMFVGPFGKKVLHGAATLGVLVEFSPLGLTNASTLRGWCRRGGGSRRMCSLRP